MAAVSNAIVHLTMRFGEEELAYGTGLLYERDGQTFIVTAWHNVTGLNSETLNHLNEKKAAVPDNVVARMTVQWHGTMYEPVPVTLPLADEEKALFYVHPRKWPRVDVVAIPIDLTIEHLCERLMSTGEVRRTRILITGDPGSSGRVCTVQKYLTSKEDADKWSNAVDVTEELFIPGYPLNIRDRSGPIWKRATVASSFQSGWNGERKFLIDSASQSGMSGAPVLYYDPKGIIRVGGTTSYTSREAVILAGIYVGRIGVQGDRDPQIGIVWHASVIDEIIDGRCHEHLPAEIEINNVDLEAAIAKELSTCSKKGLENVNNKTLPSRNYVQNDVLKAIGGRAKPQRVLEAILEMAQRYDGPLMPDEVE